jgi:hypothetical protein
VTTVVQEVQALVHLETQTPMDVTDNQLMALVNTLIRGFSGPASEIDAVERDTMHALQPLSGTDKTIVTCMSL